MQEDQWLSHEKTEITEDNDQLIPPFNSSGCSECSERDGKHRAVTSRRIENDSIR